MDRIEDCISFVAGKAAQTVFRESREALAPCRITPVQYAVLQVLWEKDGQTAAELCSRLVLDSATITGVLDRLEKQGLLRRQADASDRRMNRLHLTPEALSIRDEAEARMDDVNQRVAARLGTSHATVVQLLRKLAIGSA